MDKSADLTQKIELYARVIEVTPHYGNNKYPEIIINAKITGIKEGNLPFIKEQDVTIVINDEYGFHPVSYYISNYQVGYIIEATGCLDKTKMVLNATKVIFSAKQDIA